MSHWIENLTLQDEKIQLIPLDRSHRAGLLDAAADGELWELWYTSVPSENNIDQYLDTALSQRDKGVEYPFVVVDAPTGAVIGSTRFYNLQPSHRRLEIGYTWYAKGYQRSHVNTTCKLLMLQYAFESKNCIAVQFMTNWHNQASRAAIARLGARQDGVLRNHRLGADGSVRDTVVFSITDYEWPGVKRALELKLNTKRS